MGRRGKIKVNESRYVNLSSLKAADFAYHVLTSNLFFSGLVYPYYGGNRNRNSAILSKNSIVVTTYNVLASDATHHAKGGGPNYCPPLEMVRWWRVIADEGHCLKSNNTNIWKAVSNIVSDHKWIVTGTPFSTNILDIKNQMIILGIEHVSKMFFAIRPENIMCMLKPIVMRHAQSQKYAGTDTTLMSLPPKVNSIGREL